MSSQGHGELTRALPDVKGDNVGFFAHIHRLRYTIFAIFVVPVYVALIYFASQRTEESEPRYELARLETAAVTLSLLSKLVVLDRMGIASLSGDGAAGDNDMIGRLYDNAVVAVRIASPTALSHSMSGAMRYDNSLIWLDQQPSRPLEELIGRSGGAIGPSGAVAERLAVLNERIDGHTRTTWFVVSGTLLPEETRPTTAENPQAAVRPGPDPSRSDDLQIRRDAPTETLAPVIFHVAMPRDVVLELFFQSRLDNPNTAEILLANGDSSGFGCLFCMSDTGSGAAREPGSGLRVNLNGVQAVVVAPGGGSWVAGADAQTVLIGGLAAAACLIILLILLGGDGVESAWRRLSAYRAHARQLLEVQVSDRSRIIQEAASGMEQYEKAIDLLGEGVLRFDVERRLTFSNAAALAVFGDDKRLRRGIRLEQFWIMLMERFEPIDQVLNSSSDAMGSSFSEALWTHSDQGIRLRARESGRTKLLLSKDDGNSGKIFAFTDVTEMEFIRNSLETYKGWSRSLLEHSNSAIYLVGTNGKFLFANSEFARTHGRSAGSDQVTLIGEYASIDVEAELAACLDGHRMSTVSERKVADRAQFVAINRFPVYDENGELLGLGCIEVDVTEVHELKRKLTKAERFAQLGQVASTYLHEFLQPLFSVRLISSVAHEEAEKPEPSLDRIRMCLGQISEQCDSVTASIEQLRHVAKPEEAPMSPTTLGAALKDALVSVRPRLDESKILIQVNGTPDQMLVLGNEKLISIVFGNLIRNSINSILEHHNGNSTGEGRITVSFEIFNQAEILCTVSDNGGGIDERDGAIDKLFEPFASLGAGFAGMGVGLAVVKQLMTSMGGDVTARNEDSGLSVSLRFKSAS